MSVELKILIDYDAKLLLHPMLPDQSALDYSIVRVGAKEGEHIIIDFYFRSDVNMIQAAYYVLAPQEAK